MSIVSMMVTEGEAASSLERMLCGGLVKRIPESMFRDTERRDATEQML